MKASTVSYFRLTLLFFIYVGRFEVARGFQVQATSQMWTPSDNAALQRFKCSPLFRHSRKRIKVVHQIQTEVAPFQRTAALILLRNTAKAPAIVSVFVKLRLEIDEKEQLDEFASVMTNSSGGLIGGSCTGGVLLLVVVIYILYRLLRNEPERFQSAVEPARQTNCPRCRARNLPSSPPPTYEASFSSPPIAWEDCIVCMSTEGSLPYPTN